MKTGFWGKELAGGRQNRLGTAVHTKQPIRILRAINGADYKREGRRQSAHTAAGHKVVAGRPEEDNFGNQRAWGQSTCKQL